MDERTGRIERWRCRAVVLGMTAVGTLGGCASHGHGHYSYGYGYSHYSSGHGHCGGADAGLLVLLVYGAAGILQWCFN